MEDWTKERVMALSNDELLKYINHMLANGYSLGRLNKEKGIRRQKVRDRLKKDGYVYDSDCNAFIQSLMYTEVRKPQNKPQESQKKQEAIISLEELLKRVEVLEMQLNTIQSNKKNTLREFKPVIFDSEVQPRNYPLHREVVELLNQVSKANSHLKVKDIVNHCLYIGLSQALHRDDIE